MYKIAISFNGELRESVVEPVVVLTSTLFEEISVKLNEELSKLYAERKASVGDLPFIRKLLNKASIYSTVSLTTSLYQYD